MSATSVTLATLVVYPKNQLMVNKNYSTWEILAVLLAVRTEADCLDIISYNAYEIYISFCNIASQYPYLLNKYLNIGILTLN